MPIAFVEALVEVAWAVLVEALSAVTVAFVEALSSTNAAFVEALSTVTAGFGGAVFGTCVAGSVFALGSSFCTGCCTFELAASVTLGIVSVSSFGSGFTATG